MPLQLARQLLQRDNTVAVGVRDTGASGLAQLQKQHEGKLVVLNMDASSKDSITEWVGSVAEAMDHVDVRRLSIRRACYESTRLTNAQ